MRAENFPCVRKIRWYRVLHVLMDGGFLFFRRGWVHYVGTLACFALIRRWRDTFPTHPGEGGFWRYRCI